MFLYGSMLDFQVEEDEEPAAELEEGAEVEKKPPKERNKDCGWYDVLLMRYSGIVWGPGYPREQVGAVLPPNFSEGRPGWSFQ